MARMQAKNADTGELEIIGVKLRSDIDLLETVRDEYAALSEYHVLRSYDRIAHFDEEILSHYRREIDAAAFLAGRRESQSYGPSLSQDHDKAPPSRGENELERSFRELVDWWREDTRHTSSIEDKVLHPAYQQIIGMGMDAVPLILRELQHRSGHWFWALNSITRKDPVSDEDAGNVRKMTDAWLDWGRARGYKDDATLGELVP